MRIFNPLLYQHHYPAVTILERARLRAHPDIGHANYRRLPRRRCVRDVALRASVGCLP